MHWVNGLFHTVTVSSVGFASSAALGPLPQHCEMRNAVFLMTGAGGILLLWLHHPSRTQFSRSLSCGWAETMNAGFMKFIPQIQRNRGKKNPTAFMATGCERTQFTAWTLHWSLSSSWAAMHLQALPRSPSSKPLPALPPPVTASPPLAPLLLSYPSSFLAGGTQGFSVPLLPSLDLGRTKSPLGLEASGYSPVNTPAHLFLHSLAASLTLGIASFPVCFQQPPPSL